MHRREFVKSACIWCGTAILASELGQSCKKKDDNNIPGAFSGSFTLDLNSSANASLKTAGGSVISNNVVVINNGGSYTALSAICTHQGCTVGYNKNNSRIECPCHGGVYDTNGGVVSGPPPSALKKYTTSVSSGILTVSS